LPRDALFLAQTTKEYSDSTPAGQITQQDPPQGGLAAKGALVSIVVSKGPQPLAVPNVVGKTDSDAIAQLTAAGFEPAAGPSKHDKAPAGQVIAQDPPADTQAPKGSKVTYTVSTGPALNQIPDITGSSKAAAVAELEKAGFKVSVSYDFSDTVDSGNVISQDPTIGSFIEKTKVKIVVSQGPGVQVPTDLIGLSLGSAIAELKNLGLRTLPTSAETSGTTSVTSTIPSGGTTVAKGSKVTIHYTTTSSQ
jgi:eukaryotic-like serine/threonine-protein kinase